jgi:DNA-directed RNA polymerase specialized sigma subunit
MLFMPTPIFKSRAMLRVEERIGRTLEAYFEERYREANQEQMAEELGISGASVSRWMRELGIETRFPGQRPPAEVA